MNKKQKCFQPQMSHVLRHAARSGQRRGGGGGCFPATVSAVFAAGRGQSDRAGDMNLRLEPPEECGSVTRSGSHVKVRQADGDKVVRRAEALSQRQEKHVHILLHV